MQRIFFKKYLHKQNKKLNKNNYIKIIMKMIIMIKFLKQNLIELLNPKK